METIQCVLVLLTLCNIVDTLLRCHVNGEVFIIKLCFMNVST